ncbi:MAG: nucleotide-binding universal stress UspA family protein [Arcobacteraceae bacterium]|jgi:nucleotide-binding universal stress UspA family protein
MFKKVLVGLDGSVQSYKAFEHACEVAKACDSELYIVSVFRHHSFMEGSLSMGRGATKYDNMDDILGQHAKEIVEDGKKIASNLGLKKEKIKGFILSGQSAKQMLHFSKTNAIELIIVGKQGEGDLSGYLLGGTSHKISGLAKCPVLIV